VKVLLDECVDNRLAVYVHTLKVHTIIGKGWAGIYNSKLAVDKVPNLD
jgi:hypothetical protein